MNQLEKLWDETLGKFKEKIEDIVVFDSYFSDLKIKEVQNDKIIILIDFKFNLSFIEEEKDTLQNIFNSLSDYNYELCFIAKEDYIDQNQSEDIDIDIVDNLNAEMTFENFVVGSSNKIAQNASLAVARKPGTSYNPLFIHSQSGLGKTHLLNAIGNYMKKNNPSTKILYTTSEEFLNEYVKHIQMNKMDEFNKK